MRTSCEVGVGSFMPFASPQFCKTVLQSVVASRRWCWNNFSDFEIRSVTFYETPFPHFPRSVSQCAGKRVCAGRRIFCYSEGQRRCVRKCRIAICHAGACLAGGARGTQSRAVRRGDRVARRRRLTITFTTTHSRKNLGARHRRRSERRGLRVRLQGPERNADQADHSAICPCRPPSRSGWIHGCGDSCSSRLSHQPIFIATDESAKRPMGRKHRESCPVSARSRLRSASGGAPGFLCGRQNQLGRLPTRRF